MIEIRYGTVEELNIFLNDEDIYKDTASDDSPPRGSFSIPEDFFHTIIIGFVDRKPASYFTLHGDNELHFGTLKQYRKDYKELFHRSFNLCGKDVYCQIPLCFPLVINAAEKNGFVKNGLSEHLTFLKNGQSIPCLRMEKTVNLN